MTQAVIQSGEHKGKTVELIGAIFIDPVTGEPVAPGGGGVSGPLALDVSFGTGNVDAKTQRVTLAANGPGVAALNSLDAKTPQMQNNRTPVAVLLRPFNEANILSITNDNAQATLALPAGTVAVRVQKAAGVGVRWRIVDNNGTPITNTQGQVLLPDVVGPIDVPANAGQFLQVVRMQGDTGTGLFAVTPLSA